MSSGDPLEEALEEELVEELEEELVVDEVLEEELDELVEELEEEPLLSVESPSPLLQLAKTVKTHIALNKGSNCISYLPITLRNICRAELRFI